MTAILESLKAWVASQGVLDVLVFAGCATVSDPATWAGLSKRVLLIDADEKACSQNRSACARFKHIEVMQAVVSAVGGDQAFYRHNFPRFDGLLKPAGIVQRYPNIAAVSDESVSGITLSELLTGVPQGQRVALVLSLNGSELQVAASLNGGYDDRIALLAMQVPAAGLFGDVSAVAGAHSGVSVKSPDTTGSALAAQSEGLRLISWAQSHHWMPLVQQFQASGLYTDCVLLPNFPARLLQQDLQRAAQLQQECESLRSTMSQRDQALCSARAELDELRKTDASERETLKQLHAEASEQLRIAQELQQKRHETELANVRAQLQQHQQVDQAELQMLRQRTNDDAAQIERLQTASDKQTQLLQERAVTIDKLNTEIAKLKSKGQQEDETVKNLQSQIATLQAEIQDLRVRNEALEAGSFRLGQQVLKSEGQLQLIKEMLLGDLQPRIGQDLP